MSRVPHLEIGSPSSYCLESLIDDYLYSPTDLYHELKRISTLHRRQQQKVTTETKSMIPQQKQVFVPPPRQSSVTASTKPFPPAPPSQLSQIHAISPPTKRPPSPPSKKDLAAIARTPAPPIIPPRKESVSHSRTGPPSHQRLDTPPLSSTNTINSTVSAISMEQRALSSSARKQSLGTTSQTASLPESPTSESSENSMNEYTELEPLQDIATIPTLKHSTSSNDTELASLRTPSPKPFLINNYSDSIVTIPTLKRSINSNDTEIECRPTTAAGSGAVTTSPLMIQYGIVRQTIQKPGSAVSNWSQYVLVGINGILFLYPVKRDTVEELLVKGKNVQSLSGPFLYSGIFQGKGGEMEESAGLMKRLAVDTFSQAPLQMLELCPDSVVAEASLNVVRVTGFPVAEEDAQVLDQQELVSWLIQVDGVESQKEWSQFIRKLISC